MRTYERGVEGETQACGTGAVAAAAEAMLIHTWCSLHTPRRASDAERYDVDVRVPGGALRVALSGTVRVHPDKVVFGHAFLEGPVKLLGRGTFTWDERARTWP
jgi:diaminopimelate epimerase